MSITDELREYAKGLFNTRETVLAIADRIDAEHKRQAAEAFTKGAIDGIDMAEHSIEYVKLPVDADGVPINIGDVMAYEDNTKPMAVIALVPPAVFITEEGPRYADMCRHYHAPTVEDVLWEFAEKITDSQIPGVHPTYDEAIAEYAAKLRLADDGEEQQ